MSKITIHKTTLNDANLLEVQVGTNCPQGGDAGHGGRTVLRLIDRGGTSMQCRVNDGSFVDASKIEIVLRGDSENETFTQALDFALNVLHSTDTLTVTAEEEID